ncbi:MAG: hypothetical protein WA323_27855 [Candidatus Nitrosopolaris sp.]
MNIITINIIPMVLFLIFSSQHWNSNNSQDSPPGNSTDGGKCIGAFCQVLAQSNSVVIHTLSAQDKNVDWNTAIIGTTTIPYKQVSVFCQPVQSPTEMFSWNWCIW